MTRRRTNGVQQSATNGSLSGESERSILFTHFPSNGTFPQPNGTFPQPYVDTKTKEVEKDEEEWEEQRPTLDRFAEDTAMLGFRYLHSRYKNWFRCLWGLLLFFFVGLTIYQVCERISYYLISNPLKTTRTYDTPVSVDFPTVVVCNKMQIKASKVAEIDPRLLNAIALSLDSSEEKSRNESLAEFNEIDGFTFYANTRQSIEDFFVSCQFGKSRNCMDNVRAVLTPNGQCFAVSLNTTVRRPGPEGTLHLLLNLEVYENIPGMSEPGIVLSMFDSNAPTTVHFAEGMHLEPGKMVTIPINDIRRLQRHPSQCGPDAGRQRVFADKEYSRSACQWMARLADERAECKCEPVLSPLNRDFFSNSSFFKNPNERRTPRMNSRHCSVADELFCIHKLMDEPPSASALHSMGDCAHDCSEVSFATIVFGNELHSGDITHFLPGDWEDEKEKRLERFQLALENLPKERIPLVQRIQRIADDAQQFLNDSLRLFGVRGDSESSEIPCLLDSDGIPFAERIRRFHEQETVWKGLTEFLENSFRRNMESILVLLDLEIDSTLKLRVPTLINEHDDQWFLTQSTQALFQLLSFRNRLSKGGARGVVGISAMGSYERVIVTRHLFDFFRRLNQCIVDVQFRKENVSMQVDKCRSMFSSYYSVLYDARTVSRLLPGNSTIELQNGVNGLIAVLRKLRFELPGSIFTIRGYSVDLREFLNLYKDNGKGYELLLELLRFRKFIHSDILSKIGDFIKNVEKALKARDTILHTLSLSEPNQAAKRAEFLVETIQCFRQMIPRVENLRKSPLIRSELMSRIHYEVTVAQSYSPGPEYDRVNLLFLKIYFAHFKEELIIQERSYNLFLLLAEIGGTIGLYVGAALLSLAETMVFFFEKRAKKSVLLKE